MMSQEVSINLLELFTIFLQHLVLEQSVPLATRLHTSVLSIWLDNTVTVLFTTKFCWSSNPIAGGRLTALTTATNQKSMFLTYISLHPTTTSITNYIHRSSFGSQLRLSPSLFCGHSLTTASALMGATARVNETVPYPHKGLD
jgi:hypothetical protein